ncbi:MAG: type II toxin-antitoxin system HicB family antitoxin [Candidatus Margulisbacteria bacterium]|nr:type II toxin-antitoxin system HicB family antitoxin [Candidatus Margulisiibacteriota bacterium]
MKYKDYSAVIDYDEENRMLHGRVIGIKDVINFYGHTPEELETEFKKSIHDYLAFCKAQKKKPEKGYPGEFLLRTTPDKHRLIEEARYKAGYKSLNKWAESVLVDHAKQLVGDETVIV